MTEMTLYMDYASTAPVCTAVKSRVLEVLDVFGNPSSLHRIGMEAETLLQQARQQLLQALRATRGQVIFTGGGTEANNLAIFGSVHTLAGRGRHLITTAIEHPAVLEPFRTLEQAGFEVTYILPDNHGDIALDDVLQAIRPDTVLVSVMHVNNETGAVLPVEQLAKALRDYPKIRFHVDGTQAFGKLPLPLADIADLYTVSAHKIGGLKGTGALYVREGIKLAPVIYGGGQESGLRSGTENVLGAVAFGQAAAEAVRDLSLFEEAKLLQKEFIADLQKLPGWTVHRPQFVSPYIVNASLTGLRGEVIVHALESKGLYVSSGSACSTAGGKHKRSHVLTAMGLEAREADASIRFSWSPRITKQELAAVLRIVEEQSQWLRSMVGA